MNASTSFVQRKAFDNTNKFIDERHTYSSTTVRCLFENLRKAAARDNNDDDDDADSDKDASEMNDRDSDRYSDEFIRSRTEESATHIRSPDDSDIIVAPTTTACVHANCESDDDGRRSCVDCGTVVDECFICDQCNVATSNFRRRSKEPANIYSELPSFVDRDVKILTMEIYKLATVDKVSRNNLRMAIIMACLHRASVLKNVPIFVDNLMTLFGVSQHYANIGIAFLANALSSFPQYRIPFCSNELSVAGILDSAGMSKITQSVIKIFHVVSSRSNILNTSHYKSVVFACALFHLMHIDARVTIGEFVEKCSIVESTLLRKYRDVAYTIIRRYAKFFFSFVLLASFPTDCAFDDIAYEPNDDILVRNYADANAMTIVGGKDAFVYYVDDVDDVMEWNGLFHDKTYVHERTGLRRTVSAQFSFNGYSFEATHLDDKGALWRKIVDDGLNVDYASRDCNAIA